MNYSNIREEELKNRIAQDFFYDFDCTKIIGNIDFCVIPKTQNNQVELFDIQSVIWAEVKKGDFDLFSMFAQLILTIGKARTFDKFLPPNFLCVFDSTKIAFIEYNKIFDIFSINDFNWNVAPSNHQTKEFSVIKSKIESSLKENHHLYEFLKDENELRFFIKNNLFRKNPNGKILIDKNNFVPIYLRWYETIKPNIDFNWEQGKKQNILDSDFFLADLFIDDKNTADIQDYTPIKESLFVVFRKGNYQISKDDLNMLFNAYVNIKNKNIYEQFWKRYKRPPVKHFHEYIINRRDLLIPQDIRERKGAFFTPRIWVELSQNYLTNLFGEDWQDDYYIWDCAAGTGNLLVGLTNKYNIFASTIDQADVNVMKERIENGANLLKKHVFQFDFLNDDFSKLPETLQEIINNPRKRKKLVIYINPPYAEAATAKTVTKTSENKAGVATENKTYFKYKNEIGKASNELFTQFLIRIYKEIPDSKIANFSTLKTLNASNFDKFREVFLAKLEKLFIIPANTFDNVNGKFPIGFFIWNLENKQKFQQILADVYDKNMNLLTKKQILFYNNEKGKINNWYNKFYDKINLNNFIGIMNTRGNDFQNQNYIRITSNNNFNHTNLITINNIIETFIYFSVRHCIKASWLNDRDQFLYPSDSWKEDKEFHNNCLAFALFHSQNRISSNFGTNHWIPFSEAEVDSQGKFESNFMYNFINGKIKSEEINPEIDLFNKDIPSESESERKLKNQKIEFSEKAKNVFLSAKNLWIYYHKQENININASLYDIREHFQKRNENGKMNNKSSDDIYNQLINDLKQSLEILARKIEPKIYEHGFLK